MFTCEQYIQAVIQSLDTDRTEAIASIIDAHWQSFKVRDCHPQAEYLDLEDLAFSALNLGPEWINTICKGLTLNYYGKVAA